MTVRFDFLDTKVLLLAVPCDVEDVWRRIVHEARLPFQRGYEIVHDVWQGGVRFVAAGPARSRPVVDHDQRVFLSV